MRPEIPEAIAALLPFPLFSSAAVLTSAKDLVTTAESAGQLATLIAAFRAAGLVDTLKQPGPFTVLAPTDAAFAKLPAAAVETLLKPEHREQLCAMLTYHVVSGNVKAEAVMTTSSAKTLNGRAVTLSLSGRTFKINESTVVKADLAASNGTIHIIDTVLWPSSRRSDRLEDRGP
jgi:uncharacterized surface protein with fasciclin (FAS1) repeats